MIPNVSKGSPEVRRGLANFAPIIRYITNTEVHNAIDHQAMTEGRDSNIDRVIAIDTQRVLSVNTAAKEMRDTALQAKDLKGRAVYHFVLSWPTGEIPTPDQCFAAARDALGKLGVGEHQAVFAVHDDKPNRHVHVVVNRVHPLTHRIVHIEYDYAKLHESARESELKQGWSHDIGTSVVVERKGEKKVTHVADMQHDDKVFVRAKLDGDPVAMVEEMAKKYRRKRPAQVISSEQSPDRKVQFVLSKPQERRGLKIATIKVERIEADFAQDKAFYVGPGGTANAIEDRYKNIQGLINAGHSSLDAPELVAKPKYGGGLTLAFNDGRHRFAVARDMGAEYVNVAVDKADCNLLKNHGIALDVKPPKADRLIRMAQHLEEQARLRNINRFTGVRHATPEMLAREAETKAAKQAEAAARLERDAELVARIEASGLEGRDKGRYALELLKSQLEPDKKRAGAYKPEYTPKQEEWRAQMAAAKERLAKLQRPTPAIRPANGRYREMLAKLGSRVAQASANTPQADIARAVLADELTPGQLEARYDELRRPLPEDEFVKLLDESRQKAGRPSMLFGGRLLASHMDGYQKVYTWAGDPERKELFRDKKYKLEFTLANCDDNAILAAMKIAQRKWGDIALTGDREFRERANRVAQQYNLELCEHRKQFGRDKTPTKDRGVSMGL